MLIGIPLTILEIVASAGCLKLRPWARKAMIFYGWVAIIQVILGSIFNFAYVYPKMMAAIPATATPVMRAGMTGGMIGGTCGMILGFIFPICILYFFSRPHVKDAFNGIFPAERTNFPVEIPENPIPPSAPNGPPPLP